MDLNAKDCVPSSKIVSDFVYGQWPTLASVFEKVGSALSCSPITHSVLFEGRRHSLAVNLLASESLPSEGVLLAAAAPSMIQTMEGVPDKWYFPCSSHATTLEEAIGKKVEELFGCPLASAQPHSATQANQAVFLRNLEIGDSLLSMSLSEGGHVSHGYGRSLASQLYSIDAYGLDRDSDEVDLALIEARISSRKPKLIVVGSSAYPRHLPYDRIAEIATAYGVITLADVSHVAGLIAAGLAPAVKQSDYVTFSLHKTLLGSRAGLILSRDGLDEELSRNLSPGLQSAPFLNQLVARLVCLNEASQRTRVAALSRALSLATAFACRLTNRGIRILTGGTDTHLVLAKVPDGCSAENVVDKLERIGILCNLNYFPGDSRPVEQVTGIRFGTTVAAQLSLSSRQLEAVADLVADTIYGRTTSERAARLEVLSILGHTKVAPFDQWPP